MTTLSRRDFVARVALSSGALVLPSLFTNACNGDALIDPTESASLDLSTDAGVLNYFYAISQLQVDFWTRVNLNRFPGITTAESSAFSSLASHATSQRNWLQVYQTVGRLTDVLTFSFGDSVDFGSRVATMTAALTIEDSATQAYAGGVSYLSNPANIVLASKLASVAARHSATLRDLSDIAAGGATRTSFAGDDIVSATGLEVAAKPADVMATLSKFYKTTITVRSA